MKFENFKVQVCLAKLRADNAAPAGGGLLSLPCPPAIGIVLFLVIN